MSRTNRAPHVAWVVITTLPLLPACTQADEQAHVRIKQALESHLPNQPILSVQASPVPGIYEVFTGGAIFHTDATGSYLFVGHLIDTRTKQDLDAGRVDDLNAIDFQTLPFNRAIKTVKGNGSRKLAVFTDPDCPFCQRLEQELQSISDVTIYTFLYPLKQIHPQAEAKSRAIWCAEDPVRAWVAWMLEKKDPGCATCENDPVEELQVLGKKLHITGSPALYFANGRRLSGALPAAQLEQLLNDPNTPREALFRPQTAQAGG